MDPKTMYQADGHEVDDQVVPKNVNPVWQVKVKVEWSRRFNGLSRV